jgi:hypothetical protein
MIAIIVGINQLFKGKAPCVRTKNKAVFKTEKPGIYRADHLSWERQQERHLERDGAAMIRPEAFGLLMPGHF